MRNTFKEIEQKRFKVLNLVYEDAKKFYGSDITAEELADYLFSFDDDILKNMKFNDFETYTNILNLCSTFLKDKK